MADENQELQRIADELRNSFQGLDAATKNANVGLGAFNKELKTVPGQLAKGLGGLASSVAKGDTSLKSMNSVVDVAANAISGLAKTVPIFGEAISAATKALAEGAKIVVEQLDATAKTFNAMSATGALVADGMTGLSRQFTTAGLNLQQFQKVVGQNSVALARFRGMAGEGAEDFSKAVGALTQGQDLSLRKLGMGAEDIASTAGAFITQQTRLGRSQSMSTEQLTAGSKQYAIELDQLSKVTGLSREAIQKQQDAALSESKFRANYELAMQSGNEEQIKGAQGMMTLQTRMSSFGAEIGQGVRDLSSGVANTEASQKLLNSTGGAALDIINRLKSGSIDQDQAQQELNDAYQRNKQAQLQIASQIGATSNTYIDTAQMADFGNAMQKGAWEKAKKTQDAQIDKTDDLTNSTVAAQKNLERMNVEFSKMAIKLMPAAAKAIELMTDNMMKMVKWVNKELGREDVDTQEQDTANWKQMTASEKLESGIARGLEKAVGLVSNKGKSLLQSQRVETESEYLQKQGRPGVVSPKGSAPAGTSGSPQAGPPAPVSPKGSAPAGTSGKLEPTTQSDLKNMGLKIKEGDVQGQDNGISPTLIELAKKIQESIPGFAYFSGFNDKYHQENSPSSEHTKGLALDFALGKKPSKEEGAQIASILKGLGASYVQDEYNNASAKATGGHFHAAVSAANGAILSGPTSGYQPNLTMHGTEAIVPLNSPAAQSMGMGSDNSGIMAAQLEKLEEMVSVMKSQRSVSTKIMQYAS